MRYLIFLFISLNTFAMSECRQVLDKTTRHLGLGTFRYPSKKADVLGGKQRPSLHSAQISVFYNPQTLPNGWYITVSKNYRSVSTQWVSVDWISEEDCVISKILFIHEKYCGEKTIKLTRQICENFQVVGDDECSVATKNICEFNFN